MALEDSVTCGDHEPSHDPTQVGLDDVLHLHRLHDEELLALMHEITLAYVDTHNGALQRRCDWYRVLRSRHVVCLRTRGGVSRVWCCWQTVPRLAMGEHGERVAGIDLHTSTGSRGG